MATGLRKDEGPSCAAHEFQRRNELPTAVFAEAHNTAAHKHGYRHRLAAICVLGLVPHAGLRPHDCCILHVRCENGLFVLRIPCIHACSKVVHGPLSSLCCVIAFECATGLLQGKALIVDAGEVGMFWLFCVLGGEREQRTEADGVHEGNQIAQRHILQQRQRAPAGSQQFRLVGAYATDINRLLETGEKTRSGDCHNFSIFCPYSISMALLLVLDSWASCDLINSEARSLEPVTGSRMPWMT